MSARQNAVAAALLLLALARASPSCSAAGGYNVSIVSRSVGPGGGPLISAADGSSKFEFAFNTAWFPGNGAGVPEGLVVRVQDDQRYPWWGATGALVVVPANFSGASASAGTVTDQRVVWPGLAAPPVNHLCPPGGSQCKQPLWGAIDPRIAYRPAERTYYLGWDNCTQDCAFRQTQLSTSQNPFDQHSWVHHGALLSSAQAHQPSTAGASLLFQEPASHLAFVATGTLAHPQWEQVLVAADSSDGLAWSVLSCNATAANRCCADTSPAAREPSPDPCLDHNCCSPTPICNDPDAGQCQNHHSAKPGPGRRVLLAPRLGCWDSGGICAGPQPERLSDGNWLYVYNHDSHNEVNSPSGRCSIGWAILDGDDPTQVIARAEAPVVAGCDCSKKVPGQGKDCLVCGEPFEVAGQTPQVAFADGLRPMGGDEFVITYGAADQAVGAVLIRVHLP